MKRRILFVDDETKVLHGLRRMLGGQTHAWDMSFAAGAAEAAELLARMPYDAAVLDISMPGKSGLELLAEIKAGAQTRDIEVVVLTGLQDEKLKRDALELGANDLLNKPVLREDLIARLNSVLRIKSYQDELRAQNAALEQQLIQSQRMKVVGLLAAGAVHDLKNILMAIGGHSGLAAKRLNSDAPIRENLKTITNAAMHAEEIVRQILGLARQTRTRLEPCHLGGIIDEVLGLLRVTISNDIEVNWNGAPGCPRIQADRTQMYQLLMNLCINAVQAMGNSGVLTICLSEVKPDDDCPQSGHEGLTGACVKLEVSDTGKGMDEATLKHMCDPLFTTRASQDGSGMGLSVVQRIVQHHKGFLSVKSRLGQGTSFTVYLPVPEIADDATASESTVMRDAG